MQLSELLSPQTENIIIFHSAYREGFISRTVLKLDPFLGLRTFGKLTEVQKGGSFNGVLGELNEPIPYREKDINCTTILTIARLCLKGKKNKENCVIICYI